METADCPCCTGDGIDDGKKCAPCNGHGIVSVEWLDGFIPCPECGGTGEEAHKEVGGSCWACSGYGVSRG